MKRKPLIGINCKLVRIDGDPYYKLDRNYVRSVERAGGVPVIMPFFRSAADAKDFLRRLDGVLFTGGPDINPRRWGERKHPKADLMAEERETSDFRALRETLRRGLPALCICCGHQELNVARGGALHQHVYDLPKVKPGTHTDGAYHEVAMTGTSRTRDILGTARPRVNSWHHQSIRDVGRGLKITSYSPDGIIEGVEDPDHRFLIAIQWHPERMQDDRRQQKLFRALVSEARR